MYMCMCRALPLGHPGSAVACTALTCNPAPGDLTHPDRAAGGGWRFRCCQGRLRTPHPRPTAHGCIRREGTSEAAPEAVRQAAGGGCQSGWGRLLWHLPSGRQWVGIGRAPSRGGGRGYPPLLLPMHPCPHPNPNPIPILAASSSAPFPLPTAPPTSHQPKRQAQRCSAAGPEGRGRGRAQGMAERAAAPERSGPAVRPPPPGTPVAGMSENRAKRVHNRRPEHPFQTVQ